LVVGSANADLVARVPQCPRPGETLIGSSFATIPGGKGANQAVAAARLGATTHFVGCVGSDAFGGVLQANLDDAGVNTAYLKRHASLPTGTALIMVADAGQNSIVVIPSANYGITPDDIRALAPLFREVDAVLLQLEIPLETVEAALDLARDCGVLSILDAGPAQAVSEPLLGKADIVSPNETEAEAISGIAVRTLDDARRAGERLKAMGAREVVLKLGASGAWYDGTERVHVPAFTVTPVDTTAAGDAFTAGLATVWRHMAPAQALRFANAVGALATTVAGAQPSMPTRSAVEQFLVKHAEVST